MSSASGMEASVKPGSQDNLKCTPAELLLKVVLSGTLSHFETRGMIDDKRLEHMLLAGKQILYKSHQESDVRYANSLSLRFGSFLKQVSFATCTTPPRLTRSQTEFRFLSRGLGRPRRRPKEGYTCSRISFVCLEESDCRSQLRWLLSEPYVNQLLLLGEEY